MNSTISLRKQLEIDRKLNSFSSYMVLYCYRIANHLYEKNHRYASLAWGGVRYMIYSILRLDAQISERAQIGSNIRLLHRGQGVVISAKAVIGNNITIYHQVTIGINENLPLDKQSVHIEDHCYLSTGAKIISCHIGENCKIGPNAVVWKDTPANSLVITPSNYKIEYYATGNREIENQGSDNSSNNKQ